MKKSTEEEYVCEICGMETNRLEILKNGPCLRNPKRGGKHKIYAGGLKSEYTCKYCGRKAGSIFDLIGFLCEKHPSGVEEGSCAPE